MAKAKYSPCFNGLSECDRNCYGDIIEDLYPEHYDQKLHFQDYDEEGFDSYGYSAFDINGEYVGPTNGIDKLGNTREDYEAVDDEIFDDLRYSKEENILYHNVKELLKSKNEIKPKL